ncbi:MAG TPA: LamG-like jellyroll fold domain-containing protein [Verrucomicrobiae bacterium]|nr:LamG-like jellyroll fold domain-containing protein [Verrucomicrobiae bacterium]
MKTSSLRQLKLAIWCATAAGALQISAWGATLTNRYTFATDASDSVGGQHGTVVNGSIADGQVLLDNAFGVLSGDVNGKYVDLPDNLVTNYSSITMEVWVTPTHDDFTGGAFWNRIWDFGNTDGAAGIQPFMWMRSGNSLEAVRVDVVPVGGGSLIVGTPLANQTESHIVFTVDGATSRGRLYINGVLVGSNDNFTDTPAEMGSTTNNWLGRSQFLNGDTYFIGSINEFRIYEGALNPLEVAANHQGGPDSLNPNPGTVTNIHLQVNSPLSIGSGTKAVVTGETTALTNSVTITDLPISFSTGNSGIVTVDTNGNVTAVSSGTANIIATYAGVSATQAVQVIAIPTSLVHRYSFTSDANDSVGTAHGTLQGNAMIQDGRVVMDGSAAPPTYVDLPPFLIAATNLKNNAFTIQTWATVYPQVATWARLFDFGNIAGTAGQNYAFFSPNAGGAVRRFAIGSVGTEDQANQGGSLAGFTNVHIACVFNPNPGRQFMGLYINGVLAGTDTALINSLSTINNQFSWIGRAMFAADPMFTGEVDEFRIYDGELDRFQIAASAQAGPGSTNLSIGTFQSFAFETGGATIPLDTSRQVSAIMNFSLATNVSVLADNNLSLTSSDTNILTITSPAGVVRSTGLGTATLTAVYRYAVGATTNSYTNSVAITVVNPPAPTLVHRYSFTSDANDSVGTAHGTLEGGASVAGGELVLPGAGGYVDLPDNLLTSLADNATFELWVTDNGSATWARYLDFGNGEGQPTIFLTRQFSGAAQPRFDFASGFVNSSVPLTNGQKTHIVVVYDDANNGASIYVNGVLRGSSAAVATALATFVSTNNWIGRSQFAADPFAIANIDELRIYSGLFTQARVQASLTAGPNTLPVIVTPPMLSATLSGGNIVIRWTTNGTAAYSLQSSPALGTGQSWGSAGAPAVVGQNYQLTLPTTGDARFFRLTQ